MEDYLYQRDQLLALSEASHFSSDILLTKQEIEAQHKLKAVRDQMLCDDPSLVTGLYYDKY